MTKLPKAYFKEKVEGTIVLFYGDIEPLLDEYLPKFFQVNMQDVGFDEQHPMYDALYWFVVSWLVSMDFAEYGTSPRGAWLTEEGEQFKEYILSTKDPITHLVYD